MYYCAWCLALALISQKSIHFLKIHMTYDLRMSPGTALKRFPKDWNRFFVQYFSVLISYLFCSGTLGHILYIIGFGAWHSISEAKEIVIS